MIKSSVYLKTSIIMFIIMVGFIVYAFRHPELSFPFSIRITYVIYFVYISIMIVTFIVSIIRK